MICPAMQPDRDEPETFAEQLRRISNPPTPSLDKLEAFAKDYKRAETEERLAEAKQHRDYFNGLANEAKAMSYERESFQAREATMNAAMRYKAQALVWEREVCSLTAQLAAVVPPEVPLTAEACAAVDDMAGLEGGTT